MPTDDKNQADDNQDDNKTSDKVVFTDEQQAKVNELIQAGMGRAGRDQKQRAETLAEENKTLTGQLATAQSELTALKKKPADTDGGSKDNERIKTLEAQVTAMQEAKTAGESELETHRRAVEAAKADSGKSRGELISLRKQVAISAAASGKNFVNDETVMKLVQEHIQWSEETNSFQIVGSDGNPRMNSSFDPMTMSEFLDEFAAANPYLVRGDLKPGANSTDSARFDVTNNGKLSAKEIFGKDSDARKANQLKKENPAEYARLKAVAIGGGLLAG